MMKSGAPQAIRFEVLKDLHWAMVPACSRLKNEGKGESPPLPRCEQSKEPLGRGVSSGHRGEARPRISPGGVSVRTDFPSSPIPGGFAKQSRQLNDFQKGPSSWKC